MTRMIRHIRNFFRNIRRILLNGLLLQGRQRKIPDSIIIEPTNICNLSCSCCPHGNEKKKSRPAGFMSREIFDKLIENIDIPVKKACLYLHGEPFLNKDLSYFVQQLDQKKILTTIYSNGYNINPELLNEILKYKRTLFSFSIDIISKEHYEHIRRQAKYENMIEQLAVINNIFEENGRKFDISMIIESKYFEDTHDICEKLFTDYNCLKKILFSSRFPWPEHFYTGELNERISKKRNLCAQINGSPSIYWNGEVTMCSYDFSGKLVIGDLTKNKLSEIYNSTLIRKLRKYHYLHRFSKIPVCQKCILPRYKNSSRMVTRKQFMSENAIK